MPDVSEQPSGLRSGTNVAKVESDLLTLLGVLFSPQGQQQWRMVTWPSSSDVSLLTIGLSLFGFSDTRTSCPRAAELSNS